SLNDTIIVFDRIRENTRKYHRQPYELIINRSINETLSRTLLTSVTTLIVVVALFVLGGGIIHDFAFALIIGIIVGTYSSVYVASPVLVVWRQALTRPKGRFKARRR
ncbi:MAG: protein translocase subunit SecF, partial [Desulfobacterales bacterium]|nr:protein translocase subunit SecF [Desulfobacterales bacterium]